MRTVTFVLLILVVTCCKKINTDTDSSPDITGKWTWVCTYFIYPPGENNPLTPSNSGKEEILVFQSNRNWYRTENNIKTDSGSYSLGHGTFTPYPGAKIFIFDSICYYKNGNKINIGDYYRVYNDTLQFMPYFGGRWFSYSVSHNGSKLYKKQQ